MPVPILEVPLDQILPTSTSHQTDPDIMMAEDQGPDQSPQISPDVLPDDEFGGCIHFDLKEHVHEVPLAKKLLLQQALSFSFWIKPTENFQQVCTAIQFKTMPSDQNIILNIFDPQQHQGVDFEATGKHIIINAPVRLGQWQHIALSIEKGKDHWRMSMYHNASQMAVHLLPNEPEVIIEGLLLGGNSQSHFRGALAQLKIFEQTLSESDIKEIIANDQNAASSFRSSHPLAFQLFSGTSDDHENILFYDQNNEDVLRIQFQNTTGKNLIFAPLQKSDEFHFEIAFRPGIISQVTKNSIKNGHYDLEQWKVFINSVEDDNAIRFRRKGASYQLSPAARDEIVLPQIKLTGLGGSRQTQVLFGYQQVYFAGLAGSPIKGERLKSIELISQVGRQFIPLYVGIVGTNSVLNDGTSPNELLLRVQNRGHQAINLLREGLKNSELVLAFDIQAEGEVKHWALAPGSSSKDVELKHLPNPQTNFQFDIKAAQLGIRPEWFIQVKQNSQLAPGAYIDFQISNIVTGLSSGSANLYFQYKNIPGYWDGQLIIPIEKTPLVIHEDRIGIGTDRPRAALEVNGAIMPAAGNSENAGIMFPKNPGGGTGDAAWLRYYARSGEATNLELGTSNDHDDNIILKTGGKVGIGTDNPQAKLHVNGAIMPAAGNSENAGIMFPKNPGGGSGDSAWLRYYARSGEATNLELGTHNDSDDNIILKTGGKVGIGTDNPQAKLDVLGTVRAKSFEGPNGGGTSFRGLRGHSISFFWEYPSLYIKIDETVMKIWQG